MNIWYKISLVTMILGVAMQLLSGVFNWWIYQLHQQSFGYWTFYQLRAPFQIWGTWGLYLGAIIGIGVFIKTSMKKEK